VTEPTDPTPIPSIPRNLELRIALLTEEQTRTEITEAIARMAEGLEQAAGTLRRELARPSDPATNVARVQHELVWLVPTLGAHQLTRTAIAWTTAREAVTRLLTDGLTEGVTEGIEPA
jgi:hypothetical protein